MEEATQTKIEAPTTPENATNEGSAFVEAPSSSKNAPNEDNVSIETQYLIAKQNRSAFVGPLPPPEILSKYEDAFPGSAERIFKMAENQADHRRNMEKESLKLASRDSLLGIITGFIIATAGIFAGIYIVYLNPSSAANAFSGGFVSGSSLIGLVRTFVIGSKNRNAKQDDTDNNEQT